MERQGIEQFDRGIFWLEDKGQFSTAQDNAIDLIAVDNLQELRLALRLEDTQGQLLKDNTIDLRLFRLSRRAYLDIPGFTGGRIERSLHRELDARQEQASQALVLGMVSRDLHN